MIYLVPFLCLIYYSKSWSNCLLSYKTHMPDYFPRKLPVVTAVLQIPSAPPEHFHPHLQSGPSQDSLIKNRKSQLVFHSLCWSLVRGTVLCNPSLLRCRATGSVITREIINILHWVKAKWSQVNAARFSSGIKLNL